MNTRNTRQRQAIRDAFLETDRPLGTDEVLAYAQHHVAGLGMATVYRAIRTLVDEGWLTPVALPGEAPRYERAGKGHHHHFRCERCQRVFEAEGCADLRAVAPAGFRVTGHELVLYGLCRPCVAQDAAGKA